jgi:hypothetical protein
MKKNKEVKYEILIFSQLHKVQKEQKFVFSFLYRTEVKIGECA